jgi:hypothetical protein
MNAVTRPGRYDEDAGLAGVGTPEDGGEQEITTSHFSNSDKSNFVKRTCLL